MGFIALFSATFGIAQNTPIADAQIITYKDFNFGANVNSSSTAWLAAIQFRYAWHKTGSIKKTFESELTWVNHPKEVSRYSNFNENPNKFKYGKLNQVFFFRNGFGRKVEITERSYRNAIGLNFIYAAGINLALLKPVYLDIYHGTDGRGGYLTTEKYDPAIHTDIYNIYGNASFSNGFKEIDPVMGLYGRAALSIEMGEYTDSYYSFEVGLTADAFAKGIPMLAYVSQEQYFISAYLAFMFGWKR